MHHVMNCVFVDSSVAYDVDIMKTLRHMLYTPPLILGYQSAAVSRPCLSVLCYAVACHRVMLSYGATDVALSVNLNWTFV
jgi:hypothetical protein